MFECKPLDIIHVSSITTAAILIHGPTFKPSVVRKLRRQPQQGSGVFFRKFGEQEDLSWQMMPLVDTELKKLKCRIQPKNGGIFAAVCHRSSRFSRRYASKSKLYQLTPALEYPELTPGGTVLKQNSGKSLPYNENLDHRALAKMKASIKFREDEKPLFRAKVPLNILGFPFQSGISAGDSKELCLNLSTFLESGPSLKIAYRPNDSWNPFSFMVTTGIGHFGSPISAPLTMSAEFNLIGRRNPSFFFQFKPQIGDFSIRKSERSPIGLSSQPSVKDVDPEGRETPLQNGIHGPPQNCIFPGKKIDRHSSESNAVGAIGNLFSGIEVNARTVLPIRNHAVLKFRWGVKFPQHLKSVFMEDRIRESTARISLRKIPLLVMRKFSIEHVADEDSKSKEILPGDANVADTCLAVKRQLEAMQAENSSLRRAVEEVRLDVRVGKRVPIAGDKDSGNYGESEGNRGKFTEGRKERRNGDRKSSEFGGPAGKTMDGDDISVEGVL